MFRPTRDSASCQSKMPKRSNSGSRRSPTANRLEHRSAAGSGIVAGRHLNSARSLPGRYRWRPSATSAAGAISSPVSSRSSRAAADAKSSPVSAPPFGISHRGERVACPSNSRVPSVTRTPQLVVFIAGPAHQPAVANPAAADRGNRKRRAVAVPRVRRAAAVPHVRRAAAMPRAYRVAAMPRAYRKQSSSAAQLVRCRVAAAGSYRRSRSGVAP
jgi:hypothetical protein